MEDFRKRIKDRFDTCIQSECPRGEAMCRGGSRLLYHLILKYHKRNPKLQFDPSGLSIVSSIGHTFLLYNDGNEDIYIDPTISQFNDQYEGIFVGTKEELFQVVEKQSDRNDYIPMTTNRDLMTVVPKELEVKYNECRETRKKSSAGKRKTRRRSLYSNRNKNRK
jgi:hypothetical protein